MMVLVVHGIDAILSRPKGPPIPGASQSCQSQGRVPQQPPLRAEGGAGGGHLRGPAQFCEDFFVAEFFVRMRGVVYMGGWQNCGPLLGSYNMIRHLVCRGPKRGP